MAYALHQTTLQTPVGTIIVEGNDQMLTAVRILTREETLHDLSVTGNSKASSVTAIAARQISEYFAGIRKHFDVPLAPLASPRGAALRTGIVDIAYGHSLTYGALAKVLGSAPRAVGQACRRNPFPIIVPCHRVTSNSGPEFYSGGNGAVTKAWLMAFEHRLLPIEQRTRLL